MANDGDKLKKFLDWVNADEGLPQFDELEDGHDSHDDHGHGHGDDHGHGHGDDGHSEPDAHGEGHDTHAHDGHGTNDEQTEQEDEAKTDDELTYPDVVVTNKEESGEEPKALRQPAIRLSKEQKGQLKDFHLLYGILSVVLTAGIILVLLISVVYLPDFGGENNPTINEVYTRYVEKGMEETGAVNIVAAMILDYRAFDTLGESIMLFTATMGVVMLIRTAESEKGGKQ